MNYQFHHVHIICKDLEQMISFFTDAIGAGLIARRKFVTADGASLDSKGSDAQGVRSALRGVLVQEAPT